MTALAKSILLSCLLSLCSACATTGEQALPEFALDLIDSDEAGGTAGRVMQIWRFGLKGNYVYLFNLECCDLPTPLYDHQGRYICSPGGGISGQGDGKCKDLSVNWKKGVLVWTDKHESAPQ